MVTFYQLTTIRYCVLIYLMGKLSAQIVNGIKKSMIDINLQYLAILFTLAFLIQQILLNTCQIKNFCKTEWIVSNLTVSAYLMRRRLQ